jgi:hypothetical protein
MAAEPRHRKLRHHLRLVHLERVLTMNPLPQAGRPLACLLALCLLIPAACSTVPPAAPAGNAEVVKSEPQQADQERQLAQTRSALEQARKAAPPQDGTAQSIAYHRKLAELERRVQLIGKYIQAGSTVPTHHWSLRSAEPFKAYGRRIQERVGQPATEQENEQGPRGSGAPVRGTAFVMYAIGQDGRLEDADVIESEPREIGEEFVALLREQQPFEPFSPQMAAAARRMVFSQKIVVLAKQPAVVAGSSLPACQLHHTCMFMMSE